MVDLKATPYNLDDEGVKWVEETLASMTDEEKIGQLFINMGSSRDPEYLKGVLDNYHIAGVRYQKANAEDIWEQNRCLQDNAKIPLLIAANTEAGGNGAVNDGTYVGHEVKIAATGDEKYAYELGRISGVEAAAVGCNWSFAPIVDLNNNWRNPIISVRTWAQDPDYTLKLSLAYMKGIMESNIMPAAKHWPGDGIDERDQHLSSAPNWLSVEEWDATFGKVYKGLIDAGLPSIMAGHIAMPAYQKLYNPDMKPEDIMPATLSHDLTTKLLRDKLGFQGVVVTDASHMVAMTGAMPRREVLPTAIMAGCDLFLFFNDPDEDFGWMMDALKDGRLTRERLDEAVTRTLGLKAKIGLHTTAREDLFPAKEEALKLIGTDEAKAVAVEVADKAITLVKDADKRFKPLPISPETHKRVLIVPIEGAPNPMAALGGGDGNPAERLAAQMRERGYEVEVFETLLQKAKGKGEEELAKLVMSAYEGKAPVSNITDNYDLIISAAKVNGLMQPIERVYWPSTKGTMDIPWYVHEVPTVFISFACPNHLPDVPQVKTYINAYDDKDYTLTAVLDKLEGKSEFTGVSPIDAFGGLPDSHI
ncbi:glycoside hydrolase family 3 protein [Corynebacterium uterequi]|uniref:beta-N-acetylhexosaminidase n=1 Tax=Corynebacterium uterequi TaxID=1072256 RepID=A0A0G3HLI7_9CORY|nr:glycoside hydrolase family 3 N-terminal domain-containing protein [Corynebacterium uterequi]AKK12002.1 beta-glucosidase-like glycosyl hydrolase [Corynebacterium uterequi]